jgi:hypothetical protein
MFNDSKVWDFQKKRKKEKKQRLGYGFKQSV